MGIAGDRTAVDVVWRGTWVITSGSGELQGVRGHGTFWGLSWLGDPEEYEGPGHLTHDIVGNK